MNPFRSATRIVLIFITIALCICTSFVVYKNADKEPVITTVLGIFSNVAIAIVAFYFKDKNMNKDESEK